MTLMSRILCFYGNFVLTSRVNVTTDFICLCQIQKTNVAEIINFLYGAFKAVRRPRVSAIPNGDPETD